MHAHTHVVVLTVWEWPEAYMGAPRQWEITLRLHLTFVGNKEARIMVLSTLLTVIVQIKYDFYTSHLTARRRGKSVESAWTGKQF